MSETFLFYILLVLIILGLVMLAQKFRTAYPIVLVLGGLVLSLIPGIPDISVEPEWIFVIFLPPLLYEAAWYTSWKEFWRWRRLISSFAFPVVVITAFGVAAFSVACIPGFTWALGFLLGGIVSPPDAVSASAILKHIKVPRRIVSVLEGESLLNDASSLIIFRFALIAVGTGHFAIEEAIGSFFLVVGMGILIGLGVALVYYAIHRWLPTDPNIDIVLTLTAPYAMYLLAEMFHFSGVLAVVSGGLFLSSRSHVILSHSSRLRGTNVWSALGFVLNGLVFMLIGLELPVIVDQLGDVGLGEAIVYGIAMTVFLIAIRMCCTFGAVVFTKFISRYITTADPSPGVKAPVIIGWAGMRGVVSLAAALSVPLVLANGQPFPQRNLILFITFSVILLSLVVQGLTLPVVIGWLNMEDPDRALPEEEQVEAIRRKLAARSLAILDENHQQTVEANRMLTQLRARYEHDQFGTAEESAAYATVVLDLLDRQRSWLREINRKNEVSEEVIRRYQTLLDLEQEKLQRWREK